MKPEINLQIIISLTVLIIYWTDHLFDQSNSYRKKIFIENQKLFLFAIVLIAIILVILVIQLDKKTIIAGTILSILLGAYTLFQNQLLKSIGKEFITSSGFVIGCSLPLFFDSDIHSINFPALFILFLIALQITTIQSCIEKNAEQIQISDLIGNKNTLILSSLISFPILILNYNQFSNIYSFFLLETILIACSLMIKKSNPIVLRFLTDISFIILWI